MDQVVDPLSTYRPVVRNYPHQDESLRKGWRKRGFGYLLEQGLGKTKVTLDNAAILHDLQAIDAILVLAPNEVHEQWVKEQIPEHWPRRIRLRPVVWGPSAKARRLASELITHPIAGQLPLLAMNHEALATDAGFKLAKRFLQHYRKAMLIVDESHRFKTPSRTRVRRLMALRDLAWVRRILTGTPSTQSPFDLYAQFQFLDPRILDCPSFLVFKHRYAIFSKEFVRDKKTGQLRSYPALQEYQNLDNLHTRIAPYCIIKSKAECIDLPPKIKVERPVALSKQQHALYTQVKEEGFALLDEAKRHARLRVTLPELPEELAEIVGEAKDRVSFRIKLTMLMRLQQIVGGFVTDDAKNVKRIDDLNPRQEDLLDLAHGVEGKFIVWAIYRPELEYLGTLMRKAGFQVAEFHGGVSKAERAEANDRFRDPADPLQGLIVHPASGGVGRNWAIAQTMFYYSCSYSVADRLQSEDRSHRIGLKGALTIYDFIAQGVPIDTNIRETIQQGKDLARVVLQGSDDDFRRMV